MSDCPHYVNQWGTCEICHAYKPNEALDAERASHLATRQELSAALAEADEMRRLFTSWQKQALYLQSQHEPCETHHGARRACGQCMSSTEQHLGNARAEVERLTRERDEERSEVEQLKEIQAQILGSHDAWKARAEKAEAEVERLTRERDDARAEVAAQLAEAFKAEAEAARLREVLQGYVDRHEVCVAGRCVACDSTRAALAGSPVETPYVPSLQRMTDDVRRRALAERVRDRIAARYDVPGHDGLSQRIRALDLDALLEEPT